MFQAFGIIVELVSREMFGLEIRRGSSEPLNFELNRVEMHKKLAKYFFLFSK